MGLSTVDKCLMLLPVLGLVVFLFFVWYNLSDNKKFLDYKV